MANTNFQNQHTNDSSPEILVIGAGLAGLTAATVLKQAGHEVLVVEAGDDVGGRVRTDHQEGFLLDRGFQILLTSYPELVRHLDLDSLELHLLLEQKFLKTENLKWLLTHSEIFLWD